MWNTEARERAVRMAQVLAIGQSLRELYKARESEPIPDRVLRLLNELYPSQGKQLDQPAAQQRPRACASSR